MPSSWNQLKQSGFPLDDYANWFFVHYLPGHASHLRAKELRAGDQVRLIVEAGRNGRGLIKDVIPRVAAK
jgi:hypothetical protein